MKIATFNINNVDKRLSNLLDWLSVTQPDVVCLQELKAEDRAFPIDALEAVGYGAVWRGQRTWNGVAILARGATPVITRRVLPGAGRAAKRLRCSAATEVSKDEEPAVASNQGG